MHAQTSGHDVFTFEMLYETFCDQVRTSQSAPVQVEGGGIGMVRCSREVLMAVSGIHLLLFAIFSLACLILIYTGLRAIGCVESPGGCLDRVSGHLESVRAVQVLGRSGRCEASGGEDGAVESEEVVQ